MLLAAFPSRHGEKFPGPSTARPDAAPVAPAQPFAQSEKSAQRTRPSEEAALRPLPSPATITPAWLRYAVPAPPISDRPLVAIVLDDLRLDRVRTAEAIRLGGPLTLFFMTYERPRGGRHRQRATPVTSSFCTYRWRWFDRREDPGPHGLFTALSRDEIIERLRWRLGRFGGFVGINNHMCSKFTSDERGMAPVMEELRARALMFLDVDQTQAANRQAACKVGHITSNQQATRVDQAFPHGSDAESGRKA